MMASHWEIIVIAIVIAILFGAKKIPELARSLGKAKGEFKKGLAEGERDDDAKEGDGPKPSEQK